MVATRFADLAMSLTRTPVPVHGKRLSFQLVDLAPSLDVCAGKVRRPRFESRRLSDGF